jgi:predicted PurR-regulated permease PerM
MHPRKSDFPALEAPVPPLADALLEVQELPEIKTVFLGGIFFLLFFTTLHVASEIVIPLVLAFVLKLVLQPVQRLVDRLHLPRLITSLLIVVMLISSVAGLTFSLMGPATVWAEKLPHSFPMLQERLGFISDPIETAHKFMADAENMTQGGGPKIMSVAVEGTRFSDRVFTGTRAFASAVMTTVLVLFFLLASGDTFLRRLVEILPRFKDKRQAVGISQRIEQDISRYLLTITLMNACVGITTGAVMFLCGRHDVILWGTLAFLLNYVPILGPLIGVGVFLLVGMLTAHDVGLVILPALLYLGIHIVESIMITPRLVARRLTLNPVLVILSLVFWYWIWGFSGAILAMPMLAIAKIVCDHVERLKAFGRFLEA